MTRATPTHRDATPDAEAARSRAADAREALNRYRVEMGRFADRYARLPVKLPVTCPSCRNVVDGVLDRAGSQLVLTYGCESCGEATEVHADTVWTPAESDRAGSPERTQAGEAIFPVARRLPRTVQSLCPECRAAVLGRIFVEDGAVMMEKSCPDHGYFRDCVNSDALLYAKSLWWSFEEHPGQEETCRDAGVCPAECGLCGQHQSASCLAQIDLTNRCNMSCPVCFANAGVTGVVHQPSREQIGRQLRALRAMKPSPATAIQFTGGEPTIHPEFLEIVSDARDMGFSHIQIATNGIRMADEDFARSAAEAGVHVLYLQFDGVGEDAHAPIRNYPGIWEKKVAAVENCRKLDLKLCLVPTIIRGVNDAQVGEIFNFAVANVDVISAISYQPVSFSGRIDPTELAERRYTLGHLAHDLADASGAVPLRDMFPLSIVVPLAQFLQAVTGDSKIRPSCHPDCAFGTYFLVSPEGKAYSFPEVVDIEGMFSDMNRLARRFDAKGGRLSRLDKLAIIAMFKKHFRRDAAPEGLDVRKFIDTLEGLVDKRVGRGEGEQHTYKTLMAAGMHFQDAYNFDAERAKRCVILYSTPEGLFPFCTYNCGPEYRRYVEAIHPQTNPT